MAIQRKLAVQKEGLCDFNFCAKKKKKLLTIVSQKKIKKKYRDFFDFKMSW